MKENSLNLKGFYQSIMKQSPLIYDHQFTVSFEGPQDVGGGYSTRGLPNDVQNGSDYTSITYYGKSASIPQISIEETKVAFLSQDFVVPRQVAFNGDNSWKVKILINGNMTHYYSLYNWQRSFSKLELSGGGSKVIPNVKAHVTLLDSRLQSEIKRFTLEGVFPNNIPDLDMLYENNANPLEFECTFTWQYFYDEEVGDPLAARN